MKRRAVIVARRTYLTESGKKVIAAIYMPEKESLDWSATFTIRGLTRPVRMKAYGIDTLQALMLATQGLRAHLMYCRPRVRLYEDSELGDVAIPRFVPDGFGLEWNAHIEAVLEKELTAFVRKHRKSARTPSRKKSSR